VKSVIAPICGNIAKAHGEVAEARGDEVAELRQRLEAAEKQLSVVLEERNRQQVRNLYMLDHPPLLADALLNAKERLLIISPWIYGAVVDEDFLERLEALLKRKALVRIGYGISEVETELRKSRDIEARKGLQKLAARYANLTLRRLGNTHAKILIKDEEYAVVTSFNWLSFRGDPNRKLRDEQGVLIGDPAGKSKVRRTRRAFRRRRYAPRFNRSISKSRYPCGAFGDRKGNLVKAENVLDDADGLKRSIFA
jgi:phosphatidylserine/phosphatidylglycerophosphate/cardiolipin synthase-like enzyme